MGNGSGSGVPASGVTSTALLATASPTATATTSSQEHATAAKSVTASRASTISSPLVFDRYLISVSLATLSCSHRCSSATSYQGLVTPKILIGFSRTLQRYAKRSRGLVVVGNGTYVWLQITARPHPYLPHGNNRSESHLLSRIKSASSDIEVHRCVHPPAPGRIHFGGTRPISSSSPALSLTTPSPDSLGHRDNLAQRWGPAILLTTPAPTRSHCEAVAAKRPL